MPCHPSHKTRVSIDASTFDEICTVCGATDIAAGGWGALSEPCPGKHPYDIEEPTMNKSALITGITGQDGSYLAELLLSKGYTIHGLVRRSSTGNLRNLSNIIHNKSLILHKGDITDKTSIDRFLECHEIQEIYHLADQDHVGHSLETPLYSWDVTAKGTANLLEAVKEIDHNHIRVFIPCSATMYGTTPGPQTEESPLNPQSPYACAKAAVFLMARHYRREHGLNIRCGILYNHESPRREKEYFLQKVCYEAVQVKLGLQESIDVSKKNPRLCIGWAPDFVKAMHHVMSFTLPSDYIIHGHIFPESMWVETALEMVYVQEPKTKITYKDIHFRPGPTPELYTQDTKLQQESGWMHSTSAASMVIILLNKYLKLQNKETHLV